MPAGVLHPGADDNASGVAALLEILRGLAASPVRPKRTLLFAFWTGEEEGKFGSGHYTRHPRWPLAATQVYLNLDMIGHPWPPEALRTLAAEAGLTQPQAFLDGLAPTHFAEPGISTSHRELGPILARAGRGTGMSLHLDWTDGKSGGSDYRDFARREVPFVRFFGDYFPDYHKPGDTLDQLDPEQVRTGPAPAAAAGHGGRPGDPGRGPGGRPAAPSAVSAGPQPPPASSVPGSWS